MRVVRIFAQRICIYKSLPQRSREYVDDNIIYNCASDTRKRNEYRGYAEDRVGVFSPVENSAAGTGTDEAYHWENH